MSPRLLARCLLVGLNGRPSKTMVANTSGTFGTGHLGESTAQMHLPMAKPVRTQRVQAMNSKAPNATMGTWILSPKRQLVNLQVWSSNINIICKNPNHHNLLCVFTLMFHITHKNLFVCYQCREQCNVFKKLKAVFFTPHFCRVLIRPFSNEHASLTAWQQCVRM